MFVLLTLKDGNFIILILINKIKSLYLYICNLFLYFSHILYLFFIFTLFFIAPMLVDSDEELDKVFDDSLRISKVVKPKKILGDKTNLNVNLKEKVKGDLFDSSKLHFSYKINKEEESIKIDSKEKKDHDNKEMIDQMSDKENNTLLIENNVEGNNVQSNNLEKNIINKATESFNPPNTEILLTNINQELQGLILNEKKENDLHALRSPKIKKISSNTTSQFYLREIENEFNKIRESHKKMLMTRNKVLRMVEKEIDCVKREAEKKRKNDLKIKDEEIKQRKTK
ncbi:hypothetical protein NBO_4g0036 [Nosema bombycis CQ1]|uniref:Uncharacterized protein n=1 Tax=Nosema bombycis (strain CQ1 / CVCC 102059) TaxID=578461 RepID=R0MRA3_NOSB1|nr:hypothetical protein NBO_4g0036 [Nosema bombycis CQ1]|eukprot:EOB15408.1 hypothetical protein NBO_4g0036 [Nosema bombycis CQ1]